MAIKPISDLTEASYVGTNDLLVLEQGGTAKKLSGQTLTHDIAEILDGHGGISSVRLNSNYTLSFFMGDGVEINVGNVRGATGAKGDPSTVTGVSLITGDHSPGTNDTYRVSFDNGTSFDFQVYNGADGAGNVESVNGIGPDNNGNIELTSYDASKISGKIQDSQLAENYITSSSASNTYLSKNSASQTYVTKTDFNTRKYITETVSNNGYTCRKYSDRTYDAWKTVSLTISNGYCTVNMPSIENSSTTAVVLVQAVYVPDASLSRIPTVQMNSNKTFYIYVREGSGAQSSGTYKVNIIIFGHY